MKFISHEKKSKEEKVFKKETTAEFLARGGQITKVASNKTLPKAESIRSTNAGGPATIISMDEADLYHGEYKPRKAKKKVVNPIDISALPPELRKKYVDEVIYGQEINSEETNSSITNEKNKGSGNS